MQPSRTAATFLTQEFCIIKLAHLSLFFLKYIYNSVIKACQFKAAILLIIAWANSSTDQWRNQTPGSKIWGNKVFPQQNKQKTPSHHTCLCLVSQLCVVLSQLLFSCLDTDSPYMGKVALDTTGISIPLLPPNTREFKLTEPKLCRVGLFFLNKLSQKGKVQTLL